MNLSTVFDLITALWLGFIGACIGSFLNVVAYRMPLGMSVIWQPSHCPRCEHPIRAYDNVPIFGWLWLRGKCRDCRAPISPRYAIVEFIMGLAFFVLAYVELFSGGANLLGGPITEFRGAYDNVWNPQWKLIGVYACQGFLLSLLMSISLIAMDGKKIPRQLIGIGISAGLIAALLGLRSWLGLDWYDYLDRGKLEAGPVLWFYQATASAIAGIVIGVILSAFWRDSIGAIDTSDPLLPTCLLIGLYLGYQFLAYFIVFAVGGMVIAKLLESKSRKSRTGVSVTLCFGIVFTLIQCWNLLDYHVPLYGTRLTEVSSQHP